MRRGGRVLHMSLCMSPFERLYREAVSYIHVYIVVRIFGRV